MSEYKMSKRSTDFKMTRGTKELIRQAIRETQSTNRYVLCEKVADTVEKKYMGLNLEYQLERMGIQHTGKILQAIDTYFFKYAKPSDFEPTNETTDVTDCEYETNNTNSYVSAK